MPMCQDTGVAVVFVELGQDVHLIGGDFNEAINEGVRQGYQEGYLRKSMVDDPVIDRINTGNKDIFLFKIDKDNGEIYILWEKRDLFYGEEEPPTVFEVQTGFNKVLITDVFGEQSIIETENGVLRVNITDTPIYIEETM